jgi:hypothetical protein
LHIRASVDSYLLHDYRRHKRPTRLLKTILFHCRSWVYCQETRRRTRRFDPFSVLAIVMTWQAVVLTGFCWGKVRRTLERLQRKRPPVLRPEGARNLDFAATRPRSDDSI